MGSDQGGTPEAPRGCPVAAMPVRQAHPSHWSGPRAACCRWNQPASGSARWIASCPLLGTAARFAVPTPSAAFPIGMANGDRPAPSAPSSVPPLGAVISTSGGSAARDPHPPDGRDRDEDRDGPSGFGSMATLRRFVRDGDLTAEHHGCRGRGRPRFALTATPGSPTSRPLPPAPHWPDPRCPARRLRVRHQGGAARLPPLRFSRRRNAGAAWLCVGDGRA